MYGWRARIGLVVPTNNTVIEPEFYKIAPPGISIHTTRIMTGSAFDAAGLIEMETNATRGVQELAAAGVDVIAYACLSTSLAKGLGWSEALIADIEKRTGLGATTAATATLEALKWMGIKKVALGTPYPNHIHQLVQPFLESHGFSIVSSRNLNIEGFLQVCQEAPEAAYRLGRAVDVPEAEGICILATDFRTMEIIDTLERDLGKPVVTTNQALFWKAIQLRRLGVSIAGHGALLHSCQPELSRFGRTNFDSWEKQE